MRRHLTTVLFSLLAATAAAQTPVPITPGSTQVFVWDMEALSTTVVAPDVFRLCVDTTCTPFIATYARTMSRPIPAMTPGPHTVRVQACKTYPAPRGEVCNEIALAVDVLVVTRPAVPSNMRIAPAPGGDDGGDNEMAAARVQKTGLGHNTETLSFPGSVTAGNAIVLFVSRYQANIDASQVNSALGLTYVLEKHLQRGGTGDERVALLVAYNITGGTETISLDASGSGTTLVAAEYSGVLTAAALDDSSSQSGSGAPNSSDSTSSTSDALAVGAFTHANAAAAFAPGAGWTEVAEEEDNNSNQALGAVERVISSSGDYAATWSGSFDYAAILVILKATGGGGGGVANPWNAYAQQ